MKCTFEIGQKVVLVEPYAGEAIDRAVFFGDRLPVEGHVYTVRQIEPADDEGFVWIRLVEIQNRICPFRGGEAWFNAARFRPVVTRKTDISVFTALLNTAKSPVPA